MILQDFHVHSNFCDGKDSPETVVLSAIKKGIKVLGFSGHSYTYFDDGYSMSPQSTLDYINEINCLKEKYKDKIEIYCGVEQDIYSDAPTDGFDYVIGSVHYVKCEDEFVPVDLSSKALKDGVEKFFNGDFYSFAESYFKTVSNVVSVTGANIIGHFDLISKFNENSRFFDTSHPRYVAAWKSAADALLSENRLFEINTGAISRGYRSFPYPSLEIIDYLKRNGAQFILSSDSHSADMLCYAFEEFSSLAPIEKFIPKK